jgi:hypothetical protein
VIGDPHARVRCGVRFNDVKRSSAADFFGRVKWRAPLLILFLVGSGALAADFKTLDGTEYRRVTVKRVEPDGLVILTDAGVSKIYFTELPKEVQERYAYRPRATVAPGVSVAPASTAETVATEPVAAQPITSTAVAIAQPTLTPAPAVPPLHTYELKQDYVIGGDTGSVAKRLSKGQRYRGRDLPDGIQLEIDGKKYTVPRDILSAAKD